MKTRREKIEAMLADDPHDVFLRYSLAMEQAKEGKVGEAVSGLQVLTRESPPYIPAFFMGAQQLVQQRRVEEARTWLRSGIEEARHQGDQHAAAEMSEMLTSLGLDG